MGEKMIEISEVSEEIYGRGMMKGKRILLFNDGTWRFESEYEKRNVQLQNNRRAE